MRMASRVVPAPLALLPNALTLLRLALIPIFIATRVARVGPGLLLAGAFLPPPRGAIEADGLAEVGAVAGELVACREQPGAA